MFCPTCWPRKNFAKDEGGKVAVDECTEEGEAVVVVGESQYVEISRQQNEYCNAREYRNEGQEEDEQYAQVTQQGVRPGTLNCGSEYADPNVLFGLNSSAQLTTTAKDSKRSNSPPALFEKDLKTKLAQTIGADGTLYTDLGHSIRHSKATKVKTQPSFSTSEYASIDHSVKPLPAPPMTNNKK